VIGAGFTDRSNNAGAGGTVLMVNGVMVGGTISGGRAARDTAEARKAINMPT
jgi:uncharacterized protein GlcG (DUF336 family)